CPMESWHITGTRSGARWRMVRAMRSRPVISPSLWQAEDRGGFSGTSGRYDGFRTRAFTRTGGARAESLARLTPGHREDAIADAALVISVDRPGDGVVREMAPPLAESPLPAAGPGGRAPVPCSRHGTEPRSPVWIDACR